MSISIPDIIMDNDEKEVEVLPINNEKETRHWEGSKEEGYFSTYYKILHTFNISLTIRRQNSKSNLFMPAKWEATISSNVSPIYHDYYWFENKIGFSNPDQAKKWCVETFNKKLANYKKEIITLKPLEVI